ncbi:hypothetical protein PT974_10013 [Cladobotryum mycophilum]|uniref:Secreted protein n=1 Tax=Cladobotryum mycophilum TaxID=491253 RepID=A0ABR0S9S2_9HYPO
MKRTTKTPLPAFCISLSTSPHCDNSTSENFLKQRVTFVCNKRNSFQDTRIVRGSDSTGDQAVRKLRRNHRYGRGQNKRRQEQHVDESA